MHKVHCESSGALSVDKGAQGSNWPCSSCGRVMSDYAEVGYDGPGRDGRPDPANRDCSPFQEWLTLCRSCARLYERTGL